MAAGVVEGSAAGNKPQRGIIGGAVDDFRREFILGVFADARDAEDSRDSVGEPHVDAIPRAERAQPVEDGGPQVAVYVALDDGRPRLARCRRVLVPRGLVGAGDERWHREGPVRVEPEAQQARLDADRRDGDGDRQGAAQRRALGLGGSHRARGRGGRGRRVLLGEQGDGDDHRASEEQHDPGETRQPDARTARRRGRGSELAIRPRHDDTQSANARPHAQCRTFPLSSGRGATRVA
jgi:hypothetical protein